MDWWNITVFILIPALSVLIVFLTKRNLLWTAPILSTVLAAAVTIAAIPSILTEPEYRTLFLAAALPLHILITLALTAATHFASRKTKST